MCVCVLLHYISLSFLSIFLYSRVGFSTQNPENEDKRTLKSPISNLETQAKPS